MKLTRERQVYAAILGLGIVALAADRLFFGGTTLGPGSAAAASPTPAATNAPTSAASEKPGPAPDQAPTMTLAARLDALRNSIPSDDASLGLFSTPSPWLAPPAPVETPKPEAPKPTLKEILAKHRITTLVMDRKGAGSFLVVDGTRLYVGDKFDGVRIIHLEKAAATFEYENERQRLDFEKRETPDNRPDSPQK